MLLFALPSFLVWLGLYLSARFQRRSLAPLLPWLTATGFVLFAIAIVSQAMSSDGLGRGWLYQVSWFNGLGLMMAANWLRQRCKVISPALTQLDISGHEQLNPEGEGQTTN
jgi:hypothetical protein